MNTRRLTLATLLSLCATLILALPGTPAQAAIAHKYLSQITGTPTEAFGGEVCGVTVDPASQDVYVEQSFGDAIYIFNSSGIYQSEITGRETPEGAFTESQSCSVAVSDITGDVYVGGNGLVHVFNGEGTYVATLRGAGTPADGGTPDGSFGDSKVHVTLNQASGDLYIADSTHGVVDRFNSANEYISQVTNLPNAWSLATDSSGNLYVAERSTGIVDEFSPLGNEILQITGAQEELTGVVVDSSGHIYVSGERAVNEFDSLGAYVGQTTGTPTHLFVQLSGVAVNAGGDLYVADLDPFGNEAPPAEVSIFDSNDAIVPEPAVQAPTSVTPTSVTLKGSVNPAGAQVTSCQFEYAAHGVEYAPSKFTIGRRPSYSKSIPCEQAPVQIGSGNGAVAVTATLSGLSPDTTYFYRLNAANANGAANTNGQGLSNTEGFTTPGAPQIDGESAEVNPNEKAGQTNATLQAQINPSGADTTYHFEYGETPSYGTSIPVPDGDLGPGAQPISAPEAELSKLKVGTTYHYRVVASSMFGTVDGPDQTFATLPPILVDSESVSDITATSATLEAQLNPLGAQAICHFEYVSDVSFQSTGYTAATKVPCAATLGEENAVVPVSVHLQDLAPGILYHYRILASNAIGPVEGPDRTFVTQAAGSGFTLPDGREWEMVSPPNKHGGLLAPITGESVVEASSAGGAITYLSSTPTESEPQGFTNKIQVLSTRGSSGWSSRDLAAPTEVATGQSIGNGQEYRFFSEDLSLSVLQPFGGGFTPLSSEASEQTAYLHSDYVSGNVNEPCPGSCYRPLVSGCPSVEEACAQEVEGHADVPSGTVFGGESAGKCAVTACGPSFVGGTPNLSHVVIYSDVGLMPGTAGGLYEWSDGKLVFVGVPNQNNGSEFHAISNDGSRIVFGGVSEGHEGLFLDNAASGGMVELDEGESGCIAQRECESGGGIFQGASSDGLRVYFTDRRRLTKDSGEESESDLYECQIVVVAGKPGCNLSDLTPLEDGERRANVLGVAGVSEDGSYVYFVADGALTGKEEDRNGESAEEGHPNLYLLHAGVIKLIAVLAEDDGADWTPILARHTARVSPDGEWLAFMSQAELTSYDNRDVASGNHDEEVYLYNVKAGVACASCDPTGARPAGVEYGKISDELAGGDRLWLQSQWIAANIPGWTPYLPQLALYQSRYLSDSGRLFFNSSDTLVPQDVNGAEDVYEYEPAGVGACSDSNVTFSSRSGGCVDLISSGTSAEESAFLDASEDGSEVFFITSAKLVSQDVDASVDVYDAHECSLGSPCFPSSGVSSPSCSTGDACKPAPTPQPSIFGSPPSATFSGTGNVSSPGSAGPSVKSKASTRSQKLSVALKTCRSVRNSKKRQACERKARRRYGVKVSGQAKTKKRGR